MAMNGIDVSGWQEGIDFATVPADFVIMKATQGTSYVSPDFERQYAQAKAAGRLLGVYHYIGGQGANAEAEHFIDVVGNRVGECVLCLDWESIQNGAWQDEGYLEQVVKRVKELTGVPPIVYASLSAFPWGVCERNDCGTWVAQYADNNRTGYQSAPWNEGSYSCAIRQYSSQGVLSGYGAVLDLNKAYMDADAWRAYARGSRNDAATVDIDALARAVINGDYGNGQARKDALGSNYDAVQKRVNEMLS